MKNRFLVLLVFVSLFFIPQFSFAQLDKESCKEILAGLNTGGFDEVVIMPRRMPLNTVNSRLNDNSNVNLNTYTIRLDDKAAPFELNENYVLIKGRNSGTTFYIAYDNIRFIGTDVTQGILNRQREIQIFLLD